MDTAKRRLRLIVRGRVQGVGFRAFACGRGRTLGLSGWVRNLPDRSVEAIVEGAASSVDQFVAACRRGPPGARVDEIVEHAEPPGAEAVSGFEIR